MRRRLAGSLAVVLVAAAAGMPRAHADVQPLSVSPIAAAAGYFRADGVCPKATGRIRFGWSGAPNGTGWGLMPAEPGPFSVALRMLAAAPDGPITVTLECRTIFGRTLRTLGPVTVTSGTDLLPVPVGSGAGRRIVYSLSAQQAWAIEADETVAHTWLVSGRLVPLHAGRSHLGTFAVYSKSALACTKASRCAHMVRFRTHPTGAIGFHSLPYRGKKLLQNPLELGQPRSAGCMRSAMADAEWLFNWSQIGDPVHVVP